MVRMAALALAAASVVLLTGCSPSSRPTPLTTEEVAAYESAADNQFWAETGLDESQRPEIEREEYVTVEEWPERLSDCMGEAVQADLDSGVAFYRCNRLYALSPNDQGFFSADELQAIYDYYQKSLVPCLELHGFDISFAPPRPATDKAAYLQWHPYWSMAPTVASQETVERDCPFLPGWARSS